MAALARGTIVKTNFPYDDGKKVKYRPCLVLASYKRGESTKYLLAMITRGGDTVPNHVVIGPADFQFGYEYFSPLPVDSRVLPLNLFTADAKYCFSLGAKLDDAAVDRVLAVLQAALA